MVEAVKRIAGTIYDILSYPFRTAYNFIKDLIDKIPGVFTSAVNGITNALSTVWSVIKKPFVDGWDAASKAGQTVVDWFWKVRDGINNALSGVANVIKYPFEVAFNAVKTLWNNTIGKISFTVPSWVPGMGGKGFSFPKMAKGGIVDKPTLALIGEAGPEAVIPLNMLARSENVTTPTVINLNVYALAASAEVGRQVLEALREYERVSGRSLGVA
jgi:hypothetical protein